MRLYHLTSAPDRILDIGFQDGEEQISENGSLHRGVWLSDRPLEAKAGVLGDTLLVIEVPDDVAHAHALPMPDGKPFREFCMPAALVNRFPVAVVADGIVPRPLAELLDRVPDEAGPIGLLSGDEWSDSTREFDCALLESAGPRVGILLAADPDKARRRGLDAIEHFRELGAEPRLIEVLDRAQATGEVLDDVDLLSIGGGDPRILRARLFDTPFWERVLDRWAHGMGLSGASAGAMALCHHMLVAEEGAYEPTRWSEGLGPLERFGLAVHATERGPAWLTEIVKTAPCPVVAIDDATGILLRRNADPTVIGAGEAWHATSAQDPTRPHPRRTPVSST